MNKTDIIEFFDKAAPSWDDTLKKSDEIINIILDNANCYEGKKVLDVASGTGVMIPYYKERGVSHITAVDIAPKMVEVMEQKFGSDKSISILCGDVEEVELPEMYDCIIIYNAFPHFLDPERLLDFLSTKLNPGGTLTVAHGMSKHVLDAHHQSVASKVSNGLMEADDLADLMSDNLLVVEKISDDRMYQVVGLKL